MHIFTDSSFDLKKNVAGIGILIIDGEKTRQISNYIPCRTNNYAELWAIYLASILSGSKKATIHTDSECALHFIYGTVKPKKRADFKYQEQWIEYNNLKVLAWKIKQANPNLSFEKTKAHSSNNSIEHINNNIVDLLAKKGRVMSK